MGVTRCLPPAGEDRCNNVLTSSRRRQVSRVMSPWPTMSASMCNRMFGVWRLINWKSIIVLFKLHCWVSSSKHTRDIDNPIASPHPQTHTHPSQNIRVISFTNLKAIYNTSKIGKLLETLYSTNQEILFQYLNKGSDNVNNNKAKNKNNNNTHTHTHKIYIETRHNNVPIHGQVYFSTNR